MLIVHVDIHVRPDDVASFITATLANARASREEPGIACFDLIQQSDDPTHFVLIEHYRTADDPARHKATAHYATWRDTVAPMMAEPRRGVTYRAVSADDASSAPRSA
jgi:autoinducer 2-degrading protein